MMSGRNACPRMGSAQYPLHKNMQTFVRISMPCIRSIRHSGAWIMTRRAFEWINCAYPELSMVMFIREDQGSCGDHADSIEL